MDYRGDAAPAYASSDRYPVGRSSTYHLFSTPSSTLTGDRLLTDGRQVRRRDVLLTTPGAGAPASTAENLDVIGTFFERPFRKEPVRDLPGTFARHDTDPLSRHVAVVGSPRVRLQVDAPTTTAAQHRDAGKLVLFLKIEDVAPDGSATVVRNLAAPVRVPDVGKPFSVTMPAFVHRFAAGHRIRLVVAGASPNDRGSNLPTPGRISTAPDDPATGSPSGTAAHPALPGCRRRA